MKECIRESNREIEGDKKKKEIAVERVSDNLKGNH